MLQQNTVQYSLDIVTKLKVKYTIHSQSHFLKVL